MLLNNELNLSYPESFHIMDQEERSRLQFMTKGAGECIADPERHMILSVGWQTLGLMPSLLLKTEDIAKKMCDSIRRSMEPYGYKNEALLSRNLDGSPAQGIRYQYAASEIEMTGESYVVKHKRTLYYFHCYSRTALEEENAGILDGILDSIRWS